MLTRQLSVVLSALAVLSLSACKTEAAPDAAPAKAAAFVDVDAKQAAKLLADTKGMVVLDIRTPAEFKAGHLEGAKLVDYKAKDFKAQLAKLDRDTPYLMHCRSGGRSRAAQPVFAELGFKQVYHLKTGTLGWEKASLPLVK